MAAAIPADEACEALSGADCEIVSVELPEWLEASEDAETVEIGKLAALLYIAADGQLYKHEFKLPAAPILLGGPGALIAIGEFKVTDRGIE